MSHLSPGSPCKIFAVPAATKTFYCKICFILHTMFQKTRFFPDDFEEYILYTYFLFVFRLPTYLPFVVRRTKLFNRILKTIQQNEVKIAS